jgi:hypothetical protein
MRLAGSHLYVALDVCHPKRIQRSTESKAPLAAHCVRKDKLQAHLPVEIELIWLSANIE